MRKWLCILALAASVAYADKYVDPLNGSDANDGSMGAPWRTLVNISGLADTVYITNSATCYFGDAGDRSPVDVLLTSWGPGRPTILISNVGTRLIHLGSPGRTIRMRNLKWTSSESFNPRIVNVQGVSANTVEVENCIFDMNNTTNNRSFYFRTDQAFARFHSNIFCNIITTEHVIHSEQYPYNVDFRYNRAYNIFGGLLHVRVAGCKGIVANNTGYQCTMLVSTEQDCSGVTNVNNVVDMFKPNGNNNARWICFSSPTRIIFADYTYSGDGDAQTFGVGVLRGASNVVNLSDSQLSFVNTSDVSHPDFLKVNADSVAASSAAQSTYPGLGLPSYAGWAAPLGAPTNAILSVTPVSIDLGVLTTNASYSIANAGIGTLYWTNMVVEGGAWLSASPANGTQSGLVTLSADRTGLAYGSYTGRVAVTANGDVAVQYVTVYLQKTPAKLTVSPLALDFADSHALLTFNVANAGADTLHWTNTVVSGAAWLSVAPLRGVQAGVVTASVNRAAVGYGAYTGSVVVTANGTVPAETVTVFMVKSPPNLAVSPLSLDFGTTATALPVQVWNDGEGTVGWTAAPGAAWLSAAPSSGTATSTAQNVTIAVNRAALAPSNSYNASLRFISGFAETETVAVSVSTWPPDVMGEGYLRVSIVSASDPGTPMPGRLIIYNSDSNYYVQQFVTDEGTEANRWGNNGWPAFSANGVHHPRKAVTYKVMSGNYLLTAGRGMSWRTASQPASVTAYATTDVSIALTRIVDMESRGWYCGEAHVHVVHGTATFPITSNQFLLWAESAGINFLSVNQEYLGAGQTNLAGQQAYILPMSNATCQVWMGGERPKSILGHLAEIIPSHDPFTVLDDPPYYIGCEQVRRQGGITYPVHSDRQFGALPYVWNNFYKTYPLDALLGPSFDAWSVMSCSEYRYNPRQLGWWYALLNRGARVPAAADSDYAFDALQAAFSMIGQWITYVNISGQVFSIQNVCEAIRQGRTVATTGPLLFFTLGDAQPGDVLATGTYTARIETHLSCNAFQMSQTTFAGAPLSIKTVELVRNGVNVMRWDNLNTMSTTLYHTVTETDTNAYYTVHVNTVSDTGAAVASPIYFDDRPPRQKPFMTTVEGRVYDAFSGAQKHAAVVVQRYGDTLGTFVTATDGFFKIIAPLDADVFVRPAPGDAAAGPLPVHRVMDHELVFSNVTTMGRARLGDAGGIATNAVLAGNAIQSMVDIVSTLRWEFPLKYQFRNSYVLTNFAGDFPFTSLQILSSPPPFMGYTNATAVMLLVDKYEVAPGDTVNYAAIFRMEGNPAAAAARCYVKMNVWRPYAPASYGTWGLSVYEKNSGYTDLGNGFHAFLGSITVPAFATNCYQGPGVVIDMYTRATSGTDHPTGLGLYMNVGTTKRGMLVTTTWPGVPYAWPNHLQTGLGPANLTQSSAGWNIPRQDYRPLAVLINGSITACPSNDMAMCADADDAYFYDWAHYYTQGATPKDSVRAQPVVEFPEIPAINIDPFVNGFGSNAPVVSLVAPEDGAYIEAGPPLDLECAYAFIGGDVTNVQYIVQRPDKTIVGNAGSDFVWTLADTTASGTYTWSVIVTTSSGRTAESAARTLHMVPEASLGAAAFFIISLFYRRK